jgi:hypothetical protein
VRADDKHVLINGARFAKCAHLAQAFAVTELIATVKDESIDGRERLIQEYISRSLSQEDASVRFEQVKALVSELRVSCVLMFVFLYAILPSFVCLYGLHWFVIPAGLMMLLAASLIAVQYFRAHEHIDPFRKSERLRNALQMFLCPPAAIRATDRLSVDAMVQFHPVLLAAHFLGPRAPDFIAKVIRDLEHPLRCNITDPQAISIALWYAGAQRDAIAEFLRTSRFSTISHFLDAPKWDGVSATYCPRCFGQFTVQSGECSDCPGVNLATISTAIRTEENYVRR